MSFFLCVIIFPLILLPYEDSFIVLLAGRGTEWSLDWTMPIWAHGAGLDIFYPDFNIQNKKENHLKHKTDKSMKHFWNIYMIVCLQ